MGFYTGKIKVIGSDKMCFPVDPKTLEATACSVYDAYCFSDPKIEPIETISYMEWMSRQRARESTLRRNRALNS